MIRLFLIFVCAAVVFSGCRKQGGVASGPEKNPTAAVSNKIQQVSIEKTELIRQIITARREMIRTETRIKTTLKNPMDKAALKEACIADAKWTKLSDELKELQTKTRETHLRLAAAFAEQDALVSSNRVQALPIKDVK